MSENNAPLEVTIRLRSEMPPEISARDETGAGRSWFTRLDDLIQVFREQRRSMTHFLPENLIAADLESCSVWWRPPAIASLLLVLPEGTAALMVPMPSLALMACNNRSLSSMALKGNARPDKHSELFYAPLPNIYANGAVCLGSTVMDNFDPLDEEGPWNAFWESAFSGHQVSGKSKRFPDDIRLLLLELDGKEIFPEEDLEAVGLTLGEWLIGIGGRL